MKKFSSCFLVVMILLININMTAEGADEISVYYNGEKIVFDVNPIVTNGRTMVPIRAVFETFGANVVYDSQTKQITGTKGTLEIKLTLGSTYATVKKNGVLVEYTLDAPPLAINGRTVVPLRFVGESLGATVNWNGTTKTVTIVFSEGSKVIKIGDHVEFGTYYDEPILWNCVYKEGSGVMLVSEYILCQKAFDAAESGVYGSGSSDVQKFGSNVWADSNIREWLNSSSQTVSFTTQSPVTNAVWEGYNVYADEAGFLSNFTQTERNMLKEVSHDGVTDLVYLLSYEEVNVYIGNTDSTRQRKTTSIGKEKGEYKYDTEGNYWYYWTSTPNPSFPDDVHFIRIDGKLGSDGAYCGYVGVLPALNLISDIYISGKGTIDEPYKVN